MQAAQPVAASAALARARRAALDAGHQREPMGAAPVVLGSTDGRARKLPKSHGREPVALGALMDSYLAAPVVAKSLTLPRVARAWDQICGDAVAAHTRPCALDDGVLRVQADSSAWATQLTLLAPMLVDRVNGALGERAVAAVTVAPPRAPIPEQRGRRTAKGAVGYRDTFG